jgi:ubiquinone/menaquinone biosynthesis C-methylase UbiE
MKAAWNRRAQCDAYYYVETAHWDKKPDKFFALGEERAKVLIDPVLEKLKITGTGKTAVDIGCGVGRFTRALGRRFDKVIGVDVSEDMIAQAKADNKFMENLSFLEGDGISFPIMDNTADFVWSYEVFQHMPSHGVIRSNLRETARILHKDGYGLIHFRSAHKYPPILWHIAALTPEWMITTAKRLLGKDPLTGDKAWRGAKPVRSDDIRAMCEDTGLRVVEFCEDPTHAPGTRTFAVIQIAR